jgi:hypothetical protein
MIKVLYIYWSENFDNSPYVVKNCLLSWKLKNKTWKIIELHDNNLSEYVNLEKEIPNITNKNITKTSYSDIVRIFLLDKFGDCWCDATTFCNKPLDIWLYKNIESGFFAFNKPSNDRLLSSWFLYCDKNNYIIKKWKEATIEYWNNNNETNNYFWFHHLFGDLYKNDNEFSRTWDLTPKISADGPRFIQSKGITNLLSDIVKTHINENNIPLYKLTYKYDVNKYNNKCNMEYLFNTNKLKLIHIGKCGGTTIEHVFGLKEYHLKRDYLQDEYYIIWIRNPLNRFVSAFNYSYSLINLDTKNLDINNLSLDNCLAPARIYHKMTCNYKFSERYDYLINYFQTPNNLAESITSENKIKKELAFELMNSELEHIYKGIGWYLYNGIFVEENYNKIAFVGSIENMNDDLLKLSNILNAKFNNKKIRENKNINCKFLSEKALKNLLFFFENTDYKALKTLLEYNFISHELFESYHAYHE